MSAGTAQAPARVTPNTRRVPRFPLSIPADVTVSHAGIPQSIPGRTLTLGERGLGLVLAGEVQPGDSVNLQFNLPDFGGRLQLKAVVKYQALLKCGLEFRSLTPQQQRLIEHWTRTKSVTNPNPASPVASPWSSAPAVETATAVLVETGDQTSHHAGFRRAARVILTGFLMFGGLYWWQWHQAWDELESRIPASNALSQQSAAYVQEEVMQGHVIHRIEPIYPEAARQANIQGVVALDVVVGPDGTVVDVRPISGPDELTSAAVDAVKWWRFRPYLLNGQPVRVKTRLAVDFRGN
jgi:TonB family protein